MKKPTVYKLTITDLSGVGGPMNFIGARTRVVGEHYFIYSGAAMQFAERHYKRNGAKGSEPIRWKILRGGYSSGDLSWIMYDIEKIKIK